MLKILRKLVMDYPEIKKIILWSDSCVPQNKNRIFATAIKYFLEENHQVEEIIQKYCEPGHSQIQEVDSLHSTIDRFTKKMEIPSILSLIKNLKQIKYSNEHLNVIQMQADDFLNFSKKSDMLNFQTTPFSKLKVLCYKRDEPFIMYYKNSLRETKYYKILISIRSSRKVLGTPKHIFSKLPNLKENTIDFLSKAKDVQYLLPFLPESDKNYFSVVLKLQKKN